MAAAFGWGTVAASSLVIGAIVALLFRMSLRVIGLIMGFGAGVLISAVAFDLVEEAAEKSSGHGWVAVGMFAGCGVFFGGDRLIDRLGGGDRKDATGDQESGSALSIVLGTVHRRPFQCLWEFQARSTPESSGRHRRGGTGRRAPPLVVSCSDCRDRRDGTEVHPVG